MTERFSYMDLFQKEVDLNKEKKVILNGIVIPKIQRPYAQGRTDGVSSYVRESLLEELFGTIQGNDVFDLNFIYGIIRSSDKGYVMELLDGQQRITTLFLIHWYIANQELNKDDEADKKTDRRIRQSLEKFTYETRASSKVFCKELANYHVAIPKDKTPKDIIRNAKWYFKSFDRDSTISGMLTMLNSIHEYYNNQGLRNLHTKLDNLQFYVKSLGYYNLSEELYIKMNARGLQLSPFENFKADLTGFINSSDCPAFMDPVPLYKEEADEKVPFCQNFSIKLDAKWVDLFWKAGSESFDTAFMTFFSRFFSSQYILSSADEVTDQMMQKDPTINALYTDAEDKIRSNEYFGFKPFLKVLNKKPTCIVALDKAFDVLYDYDRPGKNDCIQREMVPTWERQSIISDDFFYNPSAKMTQTKLIVMSAFFEFVDAYDSFDLNLFKTWMRVVWNIVENTNIDGLIPASSLIRKLSGLIHHIAKESEKDPDRFFEALSSWDAENPRESRAVVEEVRKARRINEDPKWLPLFTEAEAHDYFKGMVLFFYKDDMSVEDFRSAYDNVSKLFDKNGIVTEYRQDHILIRAIISRLSKWGEVNQQYITEQAEKNKYLKNLLASNDDVRALFADVASLNEVDVVKSRLQSYIDTAPAPDLSSLWPKATDDDKAAFIMTVDHLRNDFRMYDWIFEQEKAKKASFRVYWFEGQLMFAVKSNQYAKIPLDSERAAIAEQLVTDIAFDYYDSNQRLMVSQYHHSYGNDLWLLRLLPNEVKLWVGFTLYRQIKVELEFTTIELAADRMALFAGSQPLKGNERFLLLPTPGMSHLYKDRVYEPLKTMLEGVIETMTSNNVSESDEDIEFELQ